MRLAEIMGGVVTNVILVDPLNIPDWAAAFVECGDAGIGFTYSDGGFAPPAPPPVHLADQAPVSHAQMAAALALSGIITDAEAIGWVNGVLPAKITAAIVTLPEDHRLIATLRASRPSVVDPSDGIVAMLAAVEGKTEAEMVELFQLAASL